MEALGSFFQGEKISYALGQNNHLHGSFFKLISPDPQAKDMK